MIRIEKVSKVFRNKISRKKYSELQALRDVSLDVKKGDIFGVIGLSGAGKSTLVRCINCLEEPTEGEIYIDGKAMTTLSNKELRKTRQNIGMIFQHFNLLMNSTVADNIAFPLKISGYPKGEVEQRVDDLLDVVGLSDKKNAYPSQLSGGQKQRVGIARALANDPDILLSDEATSALDPITTEQILDLLLDINGKYGITIVVITHEMDVIRKVCNKVAVMEDGYPVEVGDVLKVFNAPKSKTAKSFLESDIKVEVIL